MSYVTTPTVGVDLTATPTTPEFALGTIVNANDGVYQYVHADGAIAQYALVKIDNSWEAAEGTTTLLPSTEPSAVGIAQVAFADNDYGWVFIGPGEASVLALTLCVHDVKIYTTATAGAVDDTSTTLINGLKLKTTVGGATAATGCVATTRLATVAA